ncbi:MAG: phospholipase D-like domain-containing protein [Gammaproteobacteria bacterium]|nr:phospholipase D-like domain-containing protein [Gammaproteobacteria bacterium]
MDELGLILLLIAERALAVTVIAHAVLNKRDVGSAIGWSGLAWLTPLVGSLLYGLLGINRIERRAVRLRRGGGRSGARGDTSAGLVEAHGYAQLAPIARLADRVTDLPLTEGNRIVPLVDGDAAYPAMVEAIERAERNVVLASYIFDDDRAGRRFVEALETAHRRGVDVRVLIDGAGEHYSRIPISRTLRRLGIRVEKFLHSPLPWRNRYLNLRNHRKLLVVDGKVGFTGGMNIRENCLLALEPDKPVQDLHFRLEGPVVMHLVQAFAIDWEFTTGEALDREAWFPPLDPVGESLARGVPEGPDEDFETIRQVLLAALAQATDRVRICTSYFVPDQTLIAALNTTALRGVDVEVVIPARPNLPVIRWASMAQMGLVLPAGIRVIETPPPFDHSKLMLVDDAWAFFGSSNWDVRSLRLNFEFNVECYDRDLVDALHRLLDAKVHAGRRLTLAEVERRPLPVRLRDGLTRLLSPYL